MSEAETGGADFVNGSAFFGFMGVTMALILASTLILTKTWVLPMEQPKQVLGSAASQYGGHQS